MNKASSTMFVIQPTTIIVAESLGLPSPLIVLLNTKPNKLNTAPNSTMPI